MSIVEGISNPLINAIGWTLLHSVWQILVIALLWRFSLYLARRASANIRYNLSLLALLAIPAVWLFTFIRQYEIYSKASRIVSLEIDNALFTTYGSSNFYVIQKNYHGILENFEAYTPYLFWFYAAGIILFSAYSIISYSRLYSIRYRHISILPAYWQSRYSELKTRAGIKRQVRIFQTPRISVPAVVGFFKPVILVPVAMLSSLSVEQVETILLHELYHIRRNDHYINLYQNLAEILFFYHPAIWWVSNRMRAEREKRVDEWVVSNTNKPLQYAQALISLEEKRSTTLQPVVAATQSKVLLLTRIKNIMTMKTRSFNPGQKIAALLVILTAAISVAWLNPAMTINYGHPGPDQYLDASPMLSQNAPSEAYGEISAGFPDPSDLPGQQDPVKTTEDQQPQSSKPRQIYMHNGQSIDWDDLSEEDRKKLREAINEMRLNIREVNREITEKFNSKEFQQQMQKAREDFQQAMQEARTEIGQINSEEFREQMQKAREEFRRAMQESRHELRYLRSEEFKKEMKEAGEEVRKAMDEIMLYLEEEGYESGDTTDMMNEIDWETFNHEMKTTMEEVARGLETIGPSVQSALEAIDVEGIMDDIFDSLQKAFATESENPIEEE